MGNFFTGLVPCKSCRILPRCPFLSPQSKIKRNEKNPMRFRAALSLATLFVVCFTVASWATPVPDRTIPANWVTAPDNPSQSGKIASIGDAAFSLEVTNGPDKRTVEFLIDDDTKVERKLPVGSQGHGWSIAPPMLRTSPSTLLSSLARLSRHGESKEETSFSRTGNKQSLVQHGRPRQPFAAHFHFFGLRSSDAHDSENCPAPDRKRR